VYGESPGPVRPTTNFFSRYPWRGNYPTDLWLRVNADRLRGAIKGFDTESSPFLNLKSVENSVLNDNGFPSMVDLEPKDFVKGCQVIAGCTLCSWKASQGFGNKKEGFKFKLAALHWARSPPPVTFYARSDYGRSPAKKAKETDSGWREQAYVDDCQRARRPSAVIES